jgi:hypothetical protein
MGLKTHRIRTSLGYVVIHAYDSAIVVDANSNGRSLKVGNDTIKAIIRFVKGEKWLNDGYNNYIVRYAPNTNIMWATPEQQKTVIDALTEAVNAWADKHTKEVSESHKAYLLDKLNQNELAIKATENTLLLLKKEKANLELSLCDCQC